MSQGSLNPNNRFLGQKMCSVALMQIGRYTDRHEGWYRGHPFRVSRILPSTYNQGSVQYVKEQDVTMLLRQDIRNQCAPKFSQVMKLKKNTWQCSGSKVPTQRRNKRSKITPTCFMFSDFLPYSKDKIVLKKVKKNNRKKKESFTKLHIF